MALTGWAEIKVWTELYLFWRLQEKAAFLAFARA
jgi:hypothetical protein